MMDNEQRNWECDTWEQGMEWYGNIAESGLQHGCKL